MERPAVILIDMLNDFVTGELRTERASRVIRPLRNLVDAARKHDVPVVYSNDAHFPKDSEVVHKWGPHALRGTPGAAVIPELAPEDDDYVLEKRTYSGFYETGLDPLLRSLYEGTGVRTVILGGLHTHICIRHTSADAFFRGYTIVIAKDGVEAFTEEDHQAGLKYLRDVYNAEIKTVDEIVAEFES